MRTLLMLLFLTRIYALEVTTHSGYRQEFYRWQAFNQHQGNPTGVGSKLRLSEVCIPTLGFTFREEWLSSFLGNNFYAQFDTNFGIPITAGLTGSEFSKTTVPSLITHVDTSLRGGSLFEGDLQLGRTCCTSIDWLSLTPHGGILFSWVHFNMKPGNTMPPNDGADFQMRFNRFWQGIYLGLRGDLSFCNWLGIWGSANYHHGGFKWREKWEINSQKYRNRYNMDACGYSLAGGADIYWRCLTLGFEAKYGLITFDRGHVGTPILPIADVIKTPRGGKYETLELSGKATLCF